MTQRDAVDVPRGNGLTTDEILRAHRKLQAAFAKALAEGRVPMSPSGDCPVHASEDCG